ncbi:MAG: SDR family NAD(P)-dependent oxidoreductase [Acidobacteria bacterium]|nr:SDR family NAD(P)-dependent oxidoreductase [Acidobacteriota bacterium]
MSIKNKIVKELAADYLFPWQRRKRKAQLRKLAACTLGGAAACVAARTLWRKCTAEDLTGKAVLITGGSRGLGLKLAREFARQGARVAICARDEKELKFASIQLLSEGYAVLPLPCDLNDRQQVEALIHEVKNDFGQLDVLVNNAGIINVGPVESMTAEDFEQAMQTNYFAALYAVLAALPDMQARRSGHLVNIVSMGGKISVPHLMPYSASKFALAGLSKGLQAELKKDGIAVTTVYPGLMRTGSPRNATFKGQHRAEYAWFSISDALPFTSMSAQRAACQIVSACKNREGEVVLSLPAKIADQVNSCFPALTTHLMGLVNQCLPAPGGIGKASATGEESESSWSPSWLTTLNEEAALRNNQIQ